MNVLREPYLTAYVIVRKMLWLRAYARQQRWDEELIMVPFEMDCTVRKFRTKAEDWEGWGRSPRSAGHAAYAAKQKALWLDLARHAQGLFDTALLSIRPAPQVAQ